MTNEPIKIEENSFKDNRAPKCARCRNHGMVNSLKGHKHFCQWKNCNCSRCQVVVERQRITASRVASLRQQRKLNDTGFKRSGLRFHDNLSTNRQLINLDNVKYLNEMKKFRSFDSDNDSDQGESTGTPTSLSPPVSPPSSIASNDFDSNKTKGPGSYCNDPSCHECWKISQYLLKTNINRLRAMFPMAPTIALEAALSSAKGNYNEAENSLRYTLQSPPILFKGSRPCSDPDCKECGANIPIFRKNPLQSLSPINRKRAYEGTSSVKGGASKLPYDHLRFLGGKNEEKKSTENLTNFLPPTLIKYCVDCKSRISVDDKFCGKCGFKQPLRFRTV